MPLLSTQDVSAAYDFRVTIDGVEIPLVIEVSGLKLEVDKVEYKQHTKDGKYITTQLMGRRKAGEFTVTRGLTESKTITDWLQTVMDGKTGQARKTAAVEIHDYSGALLKTYQFQNCWVKDVEIGSLKAGSTEPLTEKFTVCFDHGEVK